MEIDKVALGARIKSIRLEKSMNLKEFGFYIDNTSDSIVSRWEKGKSIPNAKRLKLIANAGGVSVDELLYGNLKSFATRVSLEVVKEFSAKYEKKAIDNYFVKFIDIKEVFEAFDNWLSDNIENITYDEEMIKEKTMEIILENKERHKTQNPVNQKEAIEKIFEKIVYAKLDLKEYFYYAEEENDEIKLILRDGMQEDLYNALDFILTNSRDQIHSLIYEFNLDQE